MTNKLLMRWSSAFTHSAFSSTFLSSQRLVIAEYSQGFLLDIFDLPFFQASCRYSPGRFASSSRDSTPVRAYVGSISGSLNTMRMKARMKPAYRAAVLCHVALFRSLMRALFRWRVAGQDPNTFGT